MEKPQAWRGWPPAAAHVAKRASDARFAGMINGASKVPDETASSVL